MSLPLLGSVWRDCMTHAVAAQGRAGNLEVKVAYSGPAVLPWLWHALVQDGEVVLLPQPIPHTAGPNGERGCRQSAAVSWQQSAPATVRALACKIHLLMSQATLMTSCWHA